MLVAAAALVAAESHGERHLQILDVFRVDRLELRESPTLIVSVMQQPVVRLLVDIERALEGHVRGLHRGERGGQEQRSQQGAGKSRRLHGSPPSRRRGERAARRAFVYCQALSARMHAVGCTSPSRRKQA